MDCFMQCLNELEKQIAKNKTQINIQFQIIKAIPVSGFEFLYRNLFVFWCFNFGVFYQKNQHH